MGGVGSTELCSISVNVCSILQTIIQLKLLGHDDRAGPALGQKGLEKGMIHNTLSMGRMAQCPSLAPVAR